MLELLATPRSRSRFDGVHRHRLLDRRRHPRRHLHDLRPRPAAQRRLHRHLQLRPGRVHGDRRLHDGDPGHRQRALASGSRCRSRSWSRSASACSSACRRCGCGRTISRSRRSRRRRRSGSSRVNARDLTGGTQGIFGLFDDSWDSVSDTIEGWLVDLGWSDPPRRCFPSCSSSGASPSLLMFVLSRVQRTPWGRVLRAVREDEDAARALGKNAFSYKLQSLAISAALGGNRRLLPGPQPQASSSPTSSSRSSPSTATRCCPRRPRQLLGGDGRGDHLLDGARGPALPRAADRTRCRSPRCASSSSG